MKSVIALSLVASAAAFAPAQTARSSTALNVDLTKEIGAQAPLGFWDPTESLGGNPTNASEADVAEFERKRWVEVRKYT